MPRLATLVPAPLRPAARRVRDFLRRWEHIPLDHPLAPDDLRADVRPAAHSFLVEKRASAPCPVAVRNHGPAVWSSYGRHPLWLTLRWLTAKREPLDIPAVRVPLPCPVHPGQQVRVDARLAAPDVVGHFLVAVDLAQDGGPALSDHSGRPILLEVQVTGRDADDIDYYKAYAVADLDRDYWTVVGPSTEAEFYRLAEAKLQHLKDVGVTPDARVLDVGCGTGQLAVALEKYLSDRGLYYGTDIGPEAVDYCRTRFTRPNFRFARNEMTAIPIDEAGFDFVTFFSVFTHTFPDETVLLLAEADRLLAPGGVILADVFTSRLVERCAGNRGAMVLNRDHFLTLARLAGLDAAVYASWPNQRHGDREVFKFTKAAR